MKTNSPWLPFLILVLYSTLSCKCKESSGEQSRLTYPESIDSAISKAGNPKLSNDTILLGFRLGMSYGEMLRHKDALINIGRIIELQGKSYGFIPLKGYCDADKGKVHHLIAELHPKFLDSSLAGIRASLYGPRFLFHGLRWEEEKGLDPFLQAAERAKSELGDTSTPMNKRNNDLKSECIEAIKRIFDDEILYLFHYKYGSPQKMESNIIKEKEYLWINSGRTIQLALRDDLSSLAIEFINADNSRDSLDLRHLVPIGNVTYSTPFFISRYNQSIKELVNQLDKKSDSIREKQEKNRVDSTGF